MRKYYLAKAQKKNAFRAFFHAKPSHCASIYTFRRRSPYTKRMMQEHPSKRNHRQMADLILERHPEMRAKIAVATNLPSEEADSMLTEVLRFLDLIAWSGKVLTPPLILDLAWHEFILFTRAYDHWCRSQFGFFIHHQPGGGKEDNLSQLRTGLKLYHLCFGTPNPRYWGHHGSLSEEIGCGGCNADQTTRNSNQ